MVRKHFSDEDIVYAPLKIGEVCCIVITTDSKT